MSDVKVDPRDEIMGASWLADRYQIAGLRARGALSLVYQGQDAVLQRPVAIKTPAAEYTAIYRAALDLTATLAHPAFLALYDAVEQDDTLFLAYEFVEGRPLADYIATGLPIRRALSLTLQVIRALAYAHTHGVTHGDLTPTAILVDRTAVARLSNAGVIPDGVYFDDVAASAFASGVADDPDTTAAELTEHIERFDTWASAAILWQLITDASPEADGAARLRSYRVDAPDGAREVIERTLRVRHPLPITTADALESELTAIEHALTASVASDEEPVPATISMLRAAKASVAASAANTPNISSLRWRKSSAVSPTATTSYGDMAPEEAPSGAPYDAQLVEDGGRLPGENYYPQAPRLNLPSRPLSINESRQSEAFWSQSQNRMSASISGADTLGGWVWALISLAVFALCFLVGFFLAPAIPFPHLP